MASCGDAPSAGVELNKQCDLGARQGVGLSVMNGWYMLPGETEAQWQRGECLYGDSERAWLQQPTRGLPGNVYGLPEAALRGRCTVKRLC